MVQQCGFPEIHPAFSEGCAEISNEAAVELVSVWGPYGAPKSTVSPPAVCSCFSSLSRLMSALFPIPPTTLLHAPFCLLAHFCKYSPSALEASDHIFGSLWSSIPDCSLSHSVCSRHLSMAVSSQSQQWVSVMFWGRETRASNTTQSILLHFPPRTITNYR